MKEARTLLLGHNGLIGTAVSNIIRARQQAEDSIFGISKEQLDLSERSSVNELKNFISSRQISRVIILAASKRQLGESASAMGLNNRISDNIAETLLEYSGHVTYISSCAVYGEKNEQTNVTENEPVSPTSFYGEHKVYSEGLYRRTLASDRLLILRPPLVYGSISSGYDPIGFIESAVQSRCIYLWGDGSELREFVHVYDAANAIACLSNKEESGCFNIVSGQSYSYREIAKEIQRYADIKISHRERTYPAVSHTYLSSKTLLDHEVRPSLGPIEVVRLNLANRYASNAGF